MIPVAILAGGLGTRLSEETILKPKPMVEIGDEPILWHIMKIYSHYGFDKFVIALGYKGGVIKKYFLDYMVGRSKVTKFDFFTDDVITDQTKERWNITCLDTGLNVQISGRIRQILEYTKTTTMLTYGDGLANININSLLKFHKESGRMATITVVQSPSRFGRVKLDPSETGISSFDEKPISGDYINGGFMVLEPSILKLGEFGDDEVFERVYLPKLANMGELSGYIHLGFWRCMDTLRDKQELNDLWDNGKAEWKVWND